MFPHFAEAVCKRFRHFAAVALERFCTWALTDARGLVAGAACSGCATFEKVCGVVNKRHKMLEDSFDKPRRFNGLEGLGLLRTRGLDSKQECGFLGPVAREAINKYLQSVRIE
jgi:hypothetical protein